MSATFDLVHDCVLEKNVSIESGPSGLDVAAVDQL